MNPIDKILLGLGLGLGAGLLIAAIIVWLSFANAHLKAELASARTSVIACQLANDEFRADAERQNNAVAALQRDSAARQVRNAATAAAWHKNADSFAAKAKRLNAAKAAGDDCKAANGLFNRFIAGGP